MTTIAKEGLERSVPFLFRDNENSPQGDGLTLTGHAAVFNQDTQIDSWEGRFLETIAPGAFKKTVRERTPVLQFDHGRHPLVGSIPIGSIESLSEDSEGLYVEARMADNWLMEPVRDAIKNKSIKGMSFRFEVIRELWEDNAGKRINDPDELMRLLWDAGERGPLKRTLKELKVHELGPVVFPAYEGTSVGLRSKQLARKFAEDQELTRYARRMLALDEAPKLEAVDLNNSNISNEVARAILFGERLNTDTPVNVTMPSLGHLVEKQLAGRDESPEDNTPLVTVLEPLDDNTRDNSDNETEDAPLINEHPLTPASGELKQRMHYAMRSMTRRIDSVNEELLGE